MPVIPRLIPCLLLKGTGLYKTRRFADPRYLGDPLNIIRIFNDKEVDEIVILDIIASKNQNIPNYELLEQISSECFMPVAYGGGIDAFEKAEHIFRLGFEKVVINSALMSNPSLISQIAKHYGSQSVVASIDAKKRPFGKYECMTYSGTRGTSIDPVELARKATDLGAGEILVNAIDRDGEMEGYDLDLIAQVAAEVSVPVVACGGAGKLSHMVDAVRQSQASAVAASSFFVYQGIHRAVLISAPSPKEIKSAFSMDAST